MTQTMLRIFAMSFIAVLMLAGCATKPTPAKDSGPAKEYPMHGEIMGVDIGGHVATIKHENIPGFMGAMTMGYPVRDDAALAKLRTGDKITATVYVKDDDMWVGNIQPAAK